MTAAVTPRNRRRVSTRATAHVLLRALLVLCAIVASSCKEASDTKPASGPATTAAVTERPSAPARAQPGENHAIRLEVLRHLVNAHQPTPEGGTGYVAYLVKDDPDGRLAASLSRAFEGRTPPFRSAERADFYLRKGRAMDAATGRPVMLFRAQVVALATTTGANPPDAGSLASRPRAEAVASWQGGRLTGESFRYRLRRDDVAWVVEGRTREGP